MLDIAIIGGGPAGLSAAINATIRNKQVVIFSKHPQNSYLYKAEKVNNYLGLPNLSGKDMVEQFLHHVNSMQIPFSQGNVLEIFNMEDKFTINAENEFYEAKTIILATGIEKSQAIEGEKKFVGKGVSYCATCDGPLYKNKTIVVIGESHESENEVKFLSNMASKIYYIPKYEKIQYINKNVEIYKENVEKISGKNFVETVKFKNKEIEVEVDGVFILKETASVSQIIKELEFEDNAIKVNRFMETNLKGVYAAGDCIGRPWQIAKAVGDGQVAALQAVSYIDKLNK